MNSTTDTNNHHGLSRFFTIVIGLSVLLGGMATVLFSLIHSTDNAVNLSQESIDVESARRVDDQTDSVTSAFASFSVQKVYSGEDVFSFHHKASKPRADLIQAFLIASRQGMNGYMRRMHQLPISFSQEDYAARQLVDLLNQSPLIFNDDPFEKNRDQEVGIIQSLHQEQIKTEIVAMIYLSQRFNDPQSMSLHELSLYRRLLELRAQETRID